MRKLSNAFAVPPVFPPETDVVVPLAPPPPPHAAAMSETPTAKDAAVTSHFHGCLRVKSLPPEAGFDGAAKGTPSPSARPCILTDVPTRKSLEPSETKGGAAPLPQLVGLVLLDHAVDAVALRRVEDAAL